jgi:undecaprenyl-diphosphatase
VNALDETVLRALYAGGSAWLFVFVVLSALGSGWVLLGVLPVFVVAKLRPHRARAALLLAALASVSIVVTLTKALTDRVRPANALAWARAAGLSPPSDPSFPSGHAAGSFAVAAFALTLHKGAGACLFALAALIAISRVALGVHYPSDVAAGALVGTLIGFGFGALAKRTA